MTRTEMPMTTAEFDAYCDARTRGGAPENLRDRFAMAALQAIRVAPLHGNEAKVAVAAYAVADAMLEARKR